MNRHGTSNCTKSFFKSIPPSSRIAVITSTRFIVRLPLSRNNKTIFDDNRLAAAAAAVMASNNGENRKQMRFLCTERPKRNRKTSFTLNIIQDYESTDDFSSSGCTTKGDDVTGVETYPRNFIRINYPGICLITFSFIPINIDKSFKYFFFFFWIRFLLYSSVKIIRIKTYVQSIMYLFPSVAYLPIRVGSGWKKE